MKKKSLIKSRAAAKKAIIATNKKGSGKGSAAFQGKQGVAQGNFGGQHGVAQGHFGTLPGTGGGS